MSATAPYAGKSASPAWHTHAVDDVYRMLGTSADGLTATEATSRLGRCGPNELRAPVPISRLAILVRQFQSWIIGILVAAAAVAGSLGELTDAIAILAIVLLNGLIGFQQEYQAEKSIAALRRMTAPQTRVLRNGRSVMVPAAQIVPGDILELEPGDIVPADARVLQSRSLQTVEAALTGESDAVEKSDQPIADPNLALGDRRNMVFSTTNVAAGEGTAVVVGTGMDTEIGRIAGLIETAAASERTPLQEKLEAFSRTLVWACLGIVLVLFALGWARGMPFIEIFMTSVSLAVAAVPEGLPAVVTIALALGVLRMSRQKALVRRLPAVETLGSTSVICTDKTGTLTVGQMTVRELFVAGQSFQVTGEGYDPQGAIFIEGEATGTEHAAPLLELATVLLACNNAELVLENNAWRVIGDPTEAALAVAGHKAGARRDSINRNLPRHHEIPFDSDRKRRTVIRKSDDGNLRAFVNGAPDLLLRRCSRIYTEDGVRPITEEDRILIERQNESMAARALRVLGSAYRDLPHGAAAAQIADEVERELTFVGLTGMFDPPRAEARDAVAQCRSAGIRVVMITGDHPRTAIAIATDLGIACDASALLTGAELDRLGDDALREMTPTVSVFARVTAEHKLRIVRALKAGGAVVAMTGDGVNDAPALKGADIGIAMGIRGTEVTKQAADMVITDDNFASLVTAIRQGRGIYDNIRKTLQYLLAGNTAELLLMTACIVVGLPAPLLPIHLLWINLVTDGLPALCLATDTIDHRVMNRGPRPGGAPMADRAFIRRLAFAGIITAAVCTSVFLWGLRSASVEAARSMTFTALVYCELLKSFSFRSDSVPFWRLSLRGNLQLPIVVAISFILQLLIHHVDVLSRLLETVLPSWPDRWLLLAAGFVPLAILELSKIVAASRCPPDDSQSLPLQRHELA